MLLDYHPSLRLQHDEDLALLRAEWVPGAAPPQQYQAALTCLLQVARERGVRHCFLDMPDMPDISVYDQIWMGRHWVPGVVQLPLERVVFHIGTRKVYNQLAVESLIALARTFIRFDIQFFSQPRAALGWLSNDAPGLAALLAEWNARWPPAAPGPSPAGPAGRPPPVPGAVSAGPLAAS